MSAVVIDASFGLVQEIKTKWKSIFDGILLASPKKHRSKATVRARHQVQSQQFLKKFQFNFNNDEDDDDQDYNKEGDRNGKQNNKQKSNGDKDDQIPTLKANTKKAYFQLSRDMNMNDTFTRCPLCNGWKLQKQMCLNCFQALHGRSIRVKDPNQKDSSTDA
ncbi:hypothetical protein MIR68_007543 [Amoeboaphelidium protococcarum]|nr:hypothetical protein MIR68_007543 [Amoeboaphelidium protococcarum]